jgi:dihydroorotate dehydrogenase
MMLDELLCARDASNGAVVFGLTFAGRVGLAAGIARTGNELAGLTALRLGHVEIGTVTRTNELLIDRSSIPAAFRVGVNFGSSIPGLDENVIEDYAAVMAAAWDDADFLVANLSSPRAGRTGNTPGVDDLLARLRSMQNRLAGRAGRMRPLLIKIAGGNTGDAMPVALVAARRLAFEGVVLVTPDLDRLKAVRDYMPCGEIVSVGGVSTQECIARRLEAGAALVQFHSAFVDGGVARYRLMRDTKGTPKRQLVEKGAPWAANADPVDRGQVARML